MCPFIIFLDGVCIRSMDTYCIVISLIVLPLFLLDLGSDRLRSIVSLRSVVTGTEVDILSDPWIPSLPGFKPPLPSHFCVDISKVSDLIMHNEARWNMQLNQFFDPFEASHILRIPIYRSASPDKLIWTSTNLGEFTSKSYQKLLANDAGESSMYNDS